MNNLLYILQKEKTYSFDQKGFDKVKLAIKKDKLDIINSAIWYSTLTAMYVGGVVTNQFLITYFVGVATSRTVKSLMKGKRRR